MPCVNYVKEHITFIEYASDNGLSSNERLLWYALIHEMNRRAIGTNWPEGYIRIANKRLLSLLPIGFDAMAKARNSLAQRGLLSFQHGRKNAELPMYQMHYLTVADNPQVSDESVDNPGETCSKPCYPASYPTKTDKVAGNMQGKTQGKTQGNVKGKTTDIYNKHKPDGTERNLNAFIDDDDDAEAEQMRARTRMMQADQEYNHDGRFDRMDANAKAAIKAIRTYFGREATPHEAERFGLLAANMGFSPDMVEIALSNAALAAARNPFAYCVQIFREWQDWEVTTPEEYGEFAYSYDRMTGRADGVKHTSEYERAKQMCEERRKKHEAERSGSNGDDTAQDL